MNENQWIWPSSGETKQVVYVTGGVFVGGVIFVGEGLAWGLRDGAFQNANHEPRKLIFSSYSLVAVSISVLAWEKKVMDKVSLPCSCWIKELSYFRGVGSNILFKWDFWKGFFWRLRMKTPGPVSECRRQASPQVLSIWIGPCPVESCNIKCFWITFTDQFFKRGVLFLAHFLTEFMKKMPLFCRSRI